MIKIMGSPNFLAARMVGCVLGVGELLGVQDMTVHVYLRHVKNAHWLNPKTLLVWQSEVRA